MTQNLVVGRYKNEEDAREGVRMKGIARCKVAARSPRGRSNNTIWGCDMDVSGVNLP